VKKFFEIEYPDSLIHFDRGSLLNCLCSPVHFAFYARDGVRVKELPAQAERPELDTLPDLVECGKVLATQTRKILDRLEYIASMTEPQGQAPRDDKHVDLGINRSGLLGGSPNVSCESPPVRPD